MTIWQIIGVAAVIASLGWLWFEVKNAPLIDDDDENLFI